MTEQVCKNCYFYGRHRKGIDDDDIASLDRDFAGGNPLVLCGLVEHFNTNKDYNLIPASTPIVVDDHGFYAALRVPPYFGCNKWQPKETPTTQSIGPAFDGSTRRRQ